MVGEERDRQRPKGRLRRLATIEDEIKARD